MLCIKMCILLEKFGYIYWHGYINIDIILIKIKSYSIVQTYQPVYIHFIVFLGIIGDMVYILKALYLILKLLTTKVEIEGRQKCFHNLGFCGAS